MDQDGSGGGGLSGRVYPAGWETKTKDQKRKYWKRRRPSGKGQSGPWGMADGSDCPPASHRRGRRQQAFTRPLVVPPQFSLF
jgi:hypothetical protein